MKKWTKKKPTQWGWYWACRTPKHVVEMVFVSQWPETNKTFIQQAGVSVMDTADDYQWFYGPIKPPRRPASKPTRRKSLEAGR